MTVGMEWLMGYCKIEGLMGWDGWWYGMEWWVGWNGWWGGICDVMVGGMECVEWMKG